MKKKIAFYLVFFFTTISYSKTCKTFTKFEIYNISDFIFTGEIIEKQNTHFKVKIIEVFKGDLDHQKTFVIRNENTIYNIGENWIFYLKKRDLNNIQMIGCGWSRKLYESKDVFFIPPPPPHSSTKKNISDDLLEYLFFNDNKIYEILNYEKIHQEIIFLRGLKNLDRIKSLEIELYESKNNIKLFFIFLGIIILFFSFFVIKIMYNLKKIKG